MDDDRGIDVAASVAALRRAGLIPPVSGLHIEGGPRGDDEVLVVEVLLPCPQDIASAVARALADVRYELRYFKVDEDGRRPGVLYGNSTPEA